MSSKETYMGTQSAMAAMRIENDLQKTDRSLYDNQGFSMYQDSSQSRER